MNTYNRRHSNSRSSSWSNQLLWVVIGVIVIAFFLMKMLWGWGNEKSPSSDVSIAITPMDEKSLVYISPNGKEQTSITTTQSLYTSDAYVLVEQGGAKGVSKNTLLDLSEKTQISYKASTGTGDLFEMEKWRIWVEATQQDVVVSMRNFNVRIPAGAIALLEQNNIIYSTAYAIRWSVDIITPIGQYTLEHGNRIMVSASDIANTQTKLSELSGPIDESITQNDLFTRNNGASYLTESSENATTTGSGTSQSGSTTSSGSSENTPGAKYIEITQPTDGLNTKGTTVTIMGNILNNEVRKVTFNDIDASVSPVNENFILQDFKLQWEINNIVYKVYDSNTTLLEKWVLIVYGPKATATSNTLVPQNYPISSKDFVITSPKTNPFATTESYVRVQGTVPANTVQYIIVNDFRLQRYVPNSTTWYYHANADIGTMKDGMNLYTIKFYDANNKLLYTQLFTIIKDNPQSPSSSSNETPPTE